MNKFLFRLSLSFAHIFEFIFYKLFYSRSKLNLISVQVVFKLKFTEEYPVWSNFHPFETFILKNLGRKAFYHNSWPQKEGPKGRKKY